jgi:RHS repeat-associated protein
MVTPVESALVRIRTLYCARGYAQIGGYCSLTGLDVAKNLGQQCPTCGNPIAPGSGNKFQKEADYVGSGEFPLRFTRSYNSLMRLGNADDGHYGFSGIYQNSGNAGFSALGVSQGEFLANLGIDSIGANWRHSYQRVINYVLEDTFGLSTAYAYRPDGEVFVFNNLAGTFTPQADVNDRLTRLTDGSGNTTGWRYVSGENDEIESYDATGRLLSIQSRAGQTQTLEYDSVGRLTRVVDQFGHALTFAYAASPGDSAATNRIVSVTDPAGGVYQFSYDSNSNLTSVTYPDLRVRQYVYENTSFVRGLTGIIDESNQRFATFGYDTNGKANLSQHANGADKVTAVYSSTSEFTTGNVSITDAAGASAGGATRTYAFSVKLGVAKNTGITQPTSSGTGTVTSSTVYNANGYASSTTDFNGVETIHVYDLSRNLETSRTDAYGTARARTITTTWHPTYRLPSLITEPNRTTGFTFDGSGNILTKTITDTGSGGTRVSTYTYNSLGQVLTIDGPRTDVTDVTTYTYYSCSTGYQCGQINTISSALGQVTTLNTYNAHGQPLTITDPNGVETTLAYDARQRLTSRQVGTETTTYDYWPTGQLKKVTLPDASCVQYTYDAAHRLTDIADGLGNTIHYTLDAMGNHTAENTYDPGNVLHRMHTRVFNTLNQLYQDVNAAGTAAVTSTFGYDNQGNPTTINAPIARNTTNTYDELNRLSQITDPASGIAIFGYDANDNLTSVKDPRNLITSYGHNGFGDVTQLVSPDSGTSFRSYDSGGNLKTTTDARGAVGTYSYDALNRITQVAYTDQTIIYGYDAGTNGVGRLTGASDAKHSMSWVYDAQGRVTGKSQMVASIMRSVGYSYTNGDLTSEVTPSGQTIAYVYTNHRITSIKVGTTTILSGVTYDPFDPVAGWTWGNGTSASRAFDEDGKLTQLQSGGEAYSYSYDNAFRITGIANTAKSNLSWTYGYDNLDRLSSANTSALSESWTYDANGNRLTQGGTYPMALVISPTSNQITSGSSAAFGSGTGSYDASGNTTQIQGNTGSYNGAGRMSSANFFGATAQFIYNALGERIYKNATGSGVTLFMYDEGHHLIGEYGSSGNLIEETVWMNDTPVATLRPSGSGIAIYYVHTDHLNTPRKISVPGSNALVWRADLDPFEVFPADNVPGDGFNQNPSGLGNFVYNLGFPGQYFDPETTSVYNLYRNYAASLGRYIESDPIGLRGGINTYAYVHGNPISRVDPLGLDDSICQFNPSMCNKSYGYVRPKTKDQICALLKSCNGDPQCAWKLANDIRKSNLPSSWQNLQDREVEDWLAVVGWPNGPQAQYPLITFWENIWKNLPFTKTTPSDLEALATIDDAVNNHLNDTPADLTKMCGSCGK